MGMIGQFKQRVTRLLTAPREELVGWRRFVQTQMRMWWLCVRQLRRNNALAMSAALSFRSMFAMVPMIVLAFLMLKGMGFDDECRDLLDGAMRTMGLDRITYTVAEQAPSAEGAVEAAAEPASGETISVAEVITSVTGKMEGKGLGAIGPVGVALLVWTALTLLMTLERSLNRIFEAARPRPLGRRVLLYWAALTLAPLLVLLTRFLSSEATEAVSGIPAVGALIGSVSWIGAFVVGAVVLAFVYQLMPNTPVRFRSAVTGAVVAFPLWLVARWGFMLYLTRVAGNSFYGSMGLIPLFLMWLNTSWWIFLFGAQSAYAAANLRRLTLTLETKREMISSWDLLAAVVSVVRLNGETNQPVSDEAVAESLGLPAEGTALLLDKLLVAGLLARTTDGDEDDGFYLPATPADRLQAADVLRIDCAYAGQSARAVEPSVRSAVGSVLSKTEAGIENLTIADIIRTK